MSFPFDPEQMPEGAPGGPMPPAPEMDFAPEDPEEEVPLAELGLPSRPADLIDYTIRRTPQERSKIGRRLADWITAYDAAMYDRMTSLMEWRRDVECMPSDNPGPWEMSSAVRAPLAAIACDNHSKGLNQQIGGQSPLLAGNAKDEQALQILGQAEDAMNALMEEAGLRDCMRLLHKDLPVAGNGAVEVYWKQQTALRPRIQHELDHEGMQLLLDSGIRPDQALAQSVQRDEQGQAQVFLGWEEEITYDGVALRFVRHEDLLVLPVTARSFEDAWAVGERVMLRGYELSQGAKEGEYFKDAVKSLLARHGDAPPLSEREAGDVEGVMVSADMPEDGDDPLDDLALYDEYLCYRLSWLGDWKRNGKLVWALATVHKDSATLLKLQYSPYEHGQSPYVLFPYLIRPNKLWGMAIAERMATISDAATAAANQFCDMVDLMTAQAGNFLYDKSRAGIKLDAWRWEPGKPNGVDDITAIMPMSFAQGIPAALEALLKWLELLKNWTDLLTASSNPTLGKESEGDKTLGEVKLVYSAAQQIFEELAAGVAECWGKVADRARWLWAQYADNDPETGQPIVRYRKSVGSSVEFHGIDPNLLRSKIDFVVNGYTGSPDRQQRVQQAQAGMAILSQNPLTMGDPETQIEALSKVLQSIGWQGWEKVIERARNLVQMQQQAAEAAALNAKATEAGAVAATEEQRTQGADQARQNEQRTQEQHQTSQLQSTVGMLGQLAQMQPPTTANGKKK